MLFKSLQDDFSEAFRDAIRGGFERGFEDSYEDTLWYHFRDAFRDFIRGGFECGFGDDLECGFGDGFGELASTPANSAEIFWRILSGIWHGSTPTRLVRLRFL
jgi:hypothetical protein